MQHTQVNLTLENGKTVPAAAPVIISASRATDIPAFYPEWLLERLNQGYVKWVNPFSGKPQYVSFAKTRAFVFWTKNPEPMFRILDIIDSRGYNYYFLFTLNDYDLEKFEPRVPSYKTRISVFRELSRRIGPERVIWRYDPILRIPGLGVEETLQRIECTGTDLLGTTHKLVFSFAQIINYKKVADNLTRLRPDLYQRQALKAVEWNDEEKYKIAEGLCLMSGKWKKTIPQFKVSSCAEPMDFSGLDITHNRCIDDNLFAQLFPNDSELMNFLGADKNKFQQLLWSPAGNQKKVKKLKDKGQRKECGCILSKDIGAYTTCPHGCIYCYANTSPEAAAGRYAVHKTNEDSL